ncbi:MAG TPA: carbohydrate kinase, partial [Planctomycetaceae bacterium]|nr:carbohydrate kinase [Planctomycetaceae bacterium]
MTLDRGQLENILERLPSLTVGLVGDLFLDRYFEIDPDRTEVSIETGLDAYQVVRVRNQPGALGTVMNNLAALGVGRLVPITVIGEDGLGDDLIRALRSMPVEETGILRSDTRLTPTYLKPLVMERDQPPRELNRLDVRSREPLSPKWRRRVNDELSRRFVEVDGWIVLDQIDQRDEGVLHAEVREALGDEASRHPEIPVIIDSRKHL